MQHSVIGQRASMTYTASTTQKDIEAIITTHAGLVKKIAWHIHSAMSSAIDIVDLIQIGMIALVEGARNYEDRGIDFTAYASMRVRGAMIDELRREAKISRSGMADKKRIEHAKNRLLHNGTCDPTAIEIAAELNITVQQYYDIASNANAMRQESIDDSYSDHDMWFADLAADPFDELELKHLKEKLTKLTSYLPEKQALVLQLYFVEEMNLEEIGATIGVGAARVCQIKKKALDTLKAMWLEENVEA
mgnify:CR=1 FL=1